MKLFETKVRQYDDASLYGHGRTIPVRVWKLFGFVVWRRVL